MKKVNLKLETRSYDIIIGSGLLRKTGDILKEIGFSGKLVIITDPLVNRLYTADLKKRLESSNFKVAIFEVPQGEDYKSLETAGRLYGEMTDFYAERQTPILAVGGGVIGDTAGFVAATYMRGVPLVQLPTTLLAQGDSSIGGKVAVNHGKLKNKIGAFYHPRLTISDIDTLKSLSPREISNGMAEIIKHGVILDTKLFDYIENNLINIKSLDNEVMEHIIYRSVEIKARVVEKDELDLGMRNILNCGHTIGHAVESVSGLKIWHGEAVAIGMLVEARISNILGIIGSSDFNRIRDVVKKAGLPTELPALSADSLLEAMRHDKKIEQGKIKFVLPSRIGGVMETGEVSDSIIKKVLGEWNGNN